MKRYFKILFFGIFLFFSCSEDSTLSPTDDMYVITVESYIENIRENTTIADNDADVYIYFGVETADLLEYILNEDGTYTKGDKTIYPQFHEIIPEDGKIIKRVESIDPKISIVIKSKHYPISIGWASFTNSRKQINYKHLYIIN